MPITSKQRKEVETKIYKIMDTLDPTEQNSNWYKNKFRKMNNDQFYKFFTQEFPIKFQMKLFEIEPKMADMLKTLEALKVPLMEDLYMPFLYKDNEGNPVKTNYSALVIYIPIKKTKQFLSKKNSMSINIAERNPKTGRLMNKDKNGNTSDREMECMAVMGLYNCMREFSTYRADAMKAKTDFYNTINTKGMVSLKDVPVDRDDAISRNTVNAYFIGAHINTNLVNTGTYFPHTLKNKKRIERK